MSADNRGLVILALLCTPGLVAAMTADPTVRLPGYRRNLLAAEARNNGVEIPAALVAQLQRLAE